MRFEFINQMEPDFGIEEGEALNNYMNNGGWITEFTKTEELEHMIADFTGTTHCIMVNNGTISLTLAALACGLNSGDEVIIPNYTMVATPNSIKIFGATPVFVDVEYETLCLDIKLVEKAITSRTKAIIFVNANGRYPKTNISDYIEICKKFNLILIEDSAQALGSHYSDGQHMGTIGTVGSFSFSSPKIISTGQGGALITNDDSIAYKIRKLKDFGRSSGGNDIHDSIGYNFKFTDIQAVIGIEQMKKLDSRIARKKEIAELYKERLFNLPQVTFFNQDLLNTVPWFYDGLFQSRDELLLYLKENNIGSRVMYPSISHQEAYNLGGVFPVSEEVGKKGLWLPSSMKLSNSQIDYICDCIFSFYSI